MADSKKEPAKLDRRDFVKLIGGGALAIGAGACLPHTGGDWSSCQVPDGGTPPAPPASNRVVEVSAPGVVGAGLKIMDFDWVARIIQAGLLALTDAADASAAWAAILPNRKPGEVVGLKVNTLNAKVSSSAAVVAALVGSLTGMGSVDAQDALVWDRDTDNFEQAGLLPQTVGCACAGTVSGTDALGYEEEAVCVAGKKMYLSKILTQQVKHLINVAVLKRHIEADGFTGCLKNHFGSFSQPINFHNLGDPARPIHQYIAGLNALPAITGVARLCVLDALIGVCKRDTSDPPDCVPAKVLFSLDPVAIDKRGSEILGEMRLAAGPDYPVEDPPNYLQLSEELGLGTTNYDLVTIEVD